MPFLQLNTNISKVYVKTTIKTPRENQLLNQKAEKAVFHVAQCLWIAIQKKKKVKICHSPIRSKIFLTNQLILVNFHFLKIWLNWCLLSGANGLYSDFIGLLRTQDTKFSNFLLKNATNFVLT